jgi:hypothetical protein
MRCPVCRAENVQPPQCRRCKADLSPLFALEAQRQRTLAEARQCLRRGEWQRAAEYVEAAESMRGDDDAKRLTALAHLLNRDFAAAFQAYQRWRAARPDTEK